MFLQLVVQFAAALSIVIAAQLFAEQAELQGERNLSTPLEWQNYIEHYEAGLLLVEMYDDEGRLHGAWQSVFPPILWTSDRERMLLIVPKDGMFYYALADPYQQVAVRASKNFSYELRREWLLKNDTVFRSCDLSWRDCFSIEFKSPVHSYELQRNQSYGGQSGRFLASPRGVTFDGRIIFYHPCRWPDLLPSPSGKWMGVWYGSRAGCIELVVTKALFGVGDPLIGNVSEATARSMIEEWRKEPDPISPSGRWRATPFGENVVEEVVGPADSGDEFADASDPEMRVWWRSDGRAYLYQGRRELGVVHVSGPRRTLEYGSAWELIGWVGHDVAYLTPLPDGDDH